MKITFSSVCWTWCRSHASQPISKVRILFSFGSTKTFMNDRSCPDTHITIFSEFTVPAGRMADFRVSIFATMREWFTETTQAGFEKFYTATRQGAGAAGCLYYGFAVSGDSLYCREGYKVSVVMIWCQAQVSSSECWGCHAPWSWHKGTCSGTHQGEWNFLS